MRSFPVRALRRVRRGPGVDDGMTIVELLVAMTIFAGVALSLAYTLQMALLSTRDNRSRVQAAHLAARELEIVRNNFGATTNGPAMLAAESVVVNPDPLPGGTPGQPLKIDGTDYTVTRTVEWLPAGTGASPCDGGTAINYPSLAVNVKVSWANMKGTPPVVSNTILTPPKGTLNSTMSFVAVKVLGAAGTGVPGVPVTLSGPGGSSVVTSADDGCSVFAVTTMGSYTASINSAGFVTFDGLTSSSKPPTTVTAGTLTQLNFAYDRASSIVVSYADDGVHALPTPLPGLTYFNTGLLPSGTRTVPVGAASMTLSNLWPFSDGYSIWAGTCKQADPASSGASRPAAEPMTPGTTQTTAVALAPVQIKATRADGSPLPSTVVRAIPNDTTGCAAGELALTLGTTGAGGNLLTSLPGGAWKLQLLDGVGSPRLLDNGSTFALTPPMVVGAAEAYVEMELG